MPNTPPVSQGTDERVKPFSTGTDFMDWQASNCEQCIASDGCALEVAVGLAYLGDGRMSRGAVALIGCESGYPHPCTLRHHKKDPSKTRDDVLARIDAALDSPTPTSSEDGNDE